MSALERDLVAFAQQLVATPSLPGEEGVVAELVATRNAVRERLMKVLAKPTLNILK